MDGFMYTSTMLQSRNGFPLYTTIIAGPISDAKAAIGVSPGDVGSVSSQGRFLHLFNIGLPSGHTLNNRSIPSSFKSIDKTSLETKTIPNFHKPGLISAGTVKQLQITPGRKIPNVAEKHRVLAQLKCIDTPGSFVFLPGGADRVECVYPDKIRQYLIQNAALFSDFAYNTLGGNEVFVVTGCDRTPDWITATWEQPETPAGVTWSLYEEIDDKGMRIQVNVHADSPGRLFHTSFRRHEVGTIFMRGFIISARKHFPTSYTPNTSPGLYSLFSCFGRPSKPRGSPRPRVTGKMNEKALTYSPCVVLNRFILDHSKGAFAISHDDQWMSMDKEIFDPKTVTLKEAVMYKILGKTNSTRILSGVGLLVKKQSKPPTQTKPAKQKHQKPAKEPKVQPSRNDPVKQRGLKNTPRQ